MENKAHAIAAGAFVIVVAIMLGALAIWLNSDRGNNHYWEMSTKDSVSGLQPQASVRFRGVPVGKVDFIGFDEKVKGNVLVRIAIDENTPITTATFATLASQGVTGLGFIALDDGPGPSTPREPNDDNPPRIELRPGLLSKLAERSESILNQVESATKSINQLLNPENQKALTSAVSKMSDAAGNLNELALTLNTTVAKKLDPALESIPPLAKNASQTMDKLGKASDDISGVATDISVVAKRLSEKDGPLDKLSDGTAALAYTADTFGAATLPRINRATEDLSRTVRVLRRTVNSVNDNPQSLIFGNGDINPGPGEQGFTPPPVTSNPTNNANQGATR